MKKIYFVLILTFLGLGNSYSQNVLDTDGLNNLDNVYLFSLKEYCQTLDSSKTKVVYVKRDHFIGDRWPNNINGFTIEYLKYDDYREVIKKNNGKVIIVGICNLECIKGQFSTGIVPFGVTYSRKVVNFINGGGWTINFDYNNELKGFVYKDKKWNGI